MVYYSKGQKAYPNLTKVIIKKKNPERYDSPETAAQNSN